MDTFPPIPASMSKLPWEPHGLSGSIYVYPLSEPAVMKKPYLGGNGNSRWTLRAKSTSGWDHTWTSVNNNNVLLDWDGNEKLANFAGSSIDSCEPTILPSAHAEHPKLNVQQPTVLSELFALGSMSYEMETTREPYSDKEDEEVKELFGGGSVSGHWRYHA